jgi:uncharacterized protein YjbJ (UPF0337 family)
MNKDQVKGTARKIKGSIEEAAGKLMGDAKLQAEGKVDKAVGAAYQAVGDIRSAGRKAAKTASYKTASGLRY